MTLSFQKNDGLCRLFLASGPNIGQAGLPFMSLKVEITADSSGEIQPG